MTWRRLQCLTDALLTGDNNIGKNEENRIALLEYALEVVSLSAESQVLLVNVESLDNLDFEVVRIKNDTQVIRRSKLPLSEEDVIDIDQGLTYALARIMASLVSQEKNQYHYNAGTSIIKSYNESIMFLQSNIYDDSGSYGV